MKKMGQAVKSVRFRILILVTLLSSLFWGVLAGSYFGFSPAETSLMGQFKIFDMNDFDTMMKISIFVGVAHIAFANLVQAYQLKSNIKRYSSLGWAMFVIAGFLLWLSLEDNNQNLQWTAYALFSIAAFARRAIPTS